MKSALLNCKSFVPPLMESQISPPYRIISEHLRYLHKWREYLYWLFNDSVCYKDFITDIQKSVDDSIKMVLLMEAVRQYDEFAIQPLEDILGKLSSFNASEICETIQISTTSPLLKKVFDPDVFISKIRLPKSTDLMILNKISDSMQSFYPGKMPITIIPDFHQMCLDVPVAEVINPNRSKQRRGNGVYYTPAPIVDYLSCLIMEKAFKGKSFAHISKKRILDPSCGCGSFLVASYRYILEKLAEHCANNRDVSFTEKAVDVLNSTIYGTDIDKNAVNWTQRLLFFTAWQSCLIYEQSPDSNFKLPSSDLDDNIICQNFLEISQHTFTGRSEPFDVVIGGPPFVRVQELFRQNPETVREYKLRFKAASSQFDLYMLFIEKAIELMGHEGHLGMSVSNSFLRSDSGKKLRELISDTCNVEEILEFEDSRVYQNALVQIALITLKKTDTKTQTKHIFVKGKDGFRRRLKNLNDGVSIRDLNIHNCKNGDWTYENRSDMEFLDKIEQAGKTIKDLSIKVHFGMATGADKVFMLKGTNSLDGKSKTIIAESRLLEGWFEFEREILQPVLRGRHIHGYEKPAPEKMCICPYDHFGVIMPESILSRNYPLSYKYLQRCREALESRRMKGNLPWYCYRTDNISRYFQSPKIITSSVINGLSFSFENQNVLCSGSTVIINPDKADISPYLLLAIFNSSVFRKWANLKMPSLGDGWKSLRVGIMHEFPIVLKNNDNEKVVLEAIDRVCEIMSRHHSMDEQGKKLSEIDERVCNLYNVSGLSD